MLMSFEETIAFTPVWLREVAEGTVPDAQVLAHLQEVFQSVEGVRGFFVVFLTEDLFGETYPEAILQAFTENASQIAGILVKNLAMSTAMIVHHDRQGDGVQKAGSLKVQQRSARLLQLLEGRGVPNFNQERSALLMSLETGNGSYSAFLDRWGYDSEQRQAIQAALT